MDKEYGGEFSVEMIEARRVLKTNIKKIREVEGLSQEAFGKKYGKSMSSISNYETGLHLPTVDMLCQLAEHYGVSIDYLSGRTPCQISTDALNHAFTPEQSYGELIQQLEQLPQEKRSLLSSLIDDIYLSCYLRRQAAEQQSALSDSIS